MKLQNYITSKFKKNPNTSYEEKLTWYDGKSMYV